MNKEAKILISSISLVILAVLAFVFFIRPALSAGEKFTVQFDIVPSIAHQTLYITVTNNQDTADNLDLKTIINETNFNTQQIRNAQFYELKDIDYTITDYKTVCNPYNEVTANGTIEHPNCTQVVSGSHIETRREWTERQLTSNQAADKEVKHQWEQIMIGKAPNNIKHFKLEFDTPVVRNGAGWGSAGTVYLAMNGKTYVDKSHSSWWNSNWTRRKALYVNETTGNNLSNQILLINVTYDSDMNASFKDLRFTNSSDNELIYNITNKVDSSYAEVYVILPFLPASANTTFYMYYGNSSVETTSTSITPLKTDLKYYWTFDETSGMIAADSIGNQNGTLSNSDIYTRGGLAKLGTAANFSGSTWIDLTGATASSTFTISAWAYQTGTVYTSENKIFDSQSGRYVIDAGYSTYKPSIWDGSSHDIADAPFTNQWAHYVTTREGATTKVYINGVNTANFTGTSVNIGGIVFIGGQYNDIGQFVGVIDEVGIWARVLTYEEALQLYNNGNGLAYPFLCTSTYTFGEEESYDTEAPKWQDNKTNTSDATKTQESVWFSINLTDNVAGGNYILSFYDGVSWDNSTTGSWISGIPVNRTKTITATRGQQVKWYWWFSDSAGNVNQTDTWQFTVANTAPTQSKPILTSTSGKNLNDDNLTCYSQSTYDADGDNVTNIYNWYLNNQPLAVLNMPFETSAKDYSGYNHAITIYGNPQFVTGKQGKALDFKGTADKIGVGNLGIGANGIATIEGWFNFRQFASESSYRGLHRVLYQHPANNHLYITGTNDYFSVASKIQKNVWHHIVLTYSGNTSTAKLYIDNKKYDIIIQSGAETIPALTNFVIGDDGSNEFFNGSIDEIRVYNKVLTEEQIASHYNLEYNKIVAQETTPGESYKCEVTPNDGYDDGITNSSDLLTVLWAITFNVTSGEENHPGIDYIDSIICNYSAFNKGDDTTNPYGPYGFPPGSWKCIFEEADYFPKTITFVADNDTTVNVVMSRSGFLSWEEHQLLDAIYKCLYEGNCTVFNLLAHINETTSKIWQRVVRTNRDVITGEQFISNTLSPTSNISINYTIDIPLKEGYETNELLPLRMFFWFTDVNKTKCFNQDKRNDSNRAEAPYCMPLIAETLGPNGGSITFVVDLHPDLPDGTYSVVRSIEIDPLVEGQQTWTNYGQEDIGMITVENAQGEPDIILTKTSETEAETEAKAGITGAVIKDFLSDKENTMFLLLIFIVGVLIYQTIIVSRLKRNKAKDL